VWDKVTESCARPGVCKVCRPVSADRSGSDPLPRKARRPPCQGGQSWELPFSSSVVPPGGMNGCPLTQSWVDDGHSPEFPTHSVLVWSHTPATTWTSVMDQKITAETPQHKAAAYRGECHSARHCLTLECVSGRSRAHFADEPIKRRQEIAPGLRD
jgi:hypothetical protein